ncbi:hypothetical protein J2S17_001066 [Cytobacillus purgationiresistens]|uniref:vWA found in TerF C terminus domain-containing protein n=1 Tax=Cytobacillus purgationiresistens TaxID=863449 RepID=A0ABU0AEM9_9BACI|nr:hypothetical protein [Cytobacillus purgationiresistens]
MALVLDISGSMRHLYKNGTVQKVVERILAVASQFDDDGSLDVWVYDNEFSRLKPVTEADFEGYVDDYILNNDLIHKFGRNDEPPVMDDVIQKYTVEDPVQTQLLSSLSMIADAKGQSRSQSYPPLINHFFGSS